MYSVKITETHLELTEITDGVFYLYLTTRRVTMKGKKTEKEMLLTKIKADAMNKDCLEHLRAVRAFMRSHGRKSVALYPPVDDSRGSIFRKMAKCVFGGRRRTTTACILGARCEIGRRRRVPSETAILTQSL